MKRDIQIALAIFVVLASTVTELAAQQSTKGGQQLAVQSRFATFGTNKVHYATAGKGNKTLVLVHGWSGNGGFWRAQAPVLASKAKVVLIDLPGHGKSDKPHTAYTMDFFGDAVVAVMRDARVNKATLIGHSMGVAVICRAYTRSPEMVTGLVAIDGLLRRPDFTREEAEKFTGPFRGAGYREHTTNFIHSMFKKPGTEALRDRVLADVLSTPQHVMSSAMEGMFGEGQPNWDLKKVEIPLIVINAPNPLWTPEYEAYAKGLSPKSEYRVIEDAGHVLTLEKPAEFNRVLIECLEKYQLIDAR